MNVRCVLGRHQWSDLDHYASATSCRRGKTCRRCGAFDGRPGERHVWEGWRYAAAASCQGWRICTRCGRQDDAPDQPRHQWDTVEYRSWDLGEVVQVCRRCQTREVHALWMLLEALPPTEAMGQYAALVEQLPADRADWREALGQRLVTVLKGEHPFRDTRETSLALSPAEWSSISRENLRLAERARITAAELLGTIGYEDARVELLASHLRNLGSPYEVTYEDPEQFSQALRESLARFGLTLSPSLEDAARQIRLGDLQQAVKLTRQLTTDPSSETVALLLVLARGQVGRAQASFDEEGPLRGAAVSALEGLFRQQPSVFTAEQLREIESLPPSLRVDFPLGGVDGLLHEAYELDFSTIVTAAAAELRRRS